VNPAHHIVMILQRPNRKIAIVYIHLEPYGVFQKSVGKHVDVDPHLRSVPKRTYENDEDDANVKVQKNFKYTFASAGAKEVECISL